MEFGKKVEGQEVRMLWSWITEKVVMENKIERAFRLWENVRSVYILSC